MKTIQTIEQLGCVYTINQLGNRSFRVSYKRGGVGRTSHVDQIFDTCEDATEYIRTCHSMDAAGAMLDRSTQQLPRKTNDSAIARLRIVRGLTQEQLAMQIGCSLRTLRRWEAGETSPNTPSLRSLAAALECSVTDLL